MPPATPATPATPAAKAPAAQAKAPPAPTKADLALKLVDIAKRHHGLQKQVAAANAAIATLTTQQTAAVASYLATSGGGNESFILDGHLVTVTAGVITIVPPSPTITTVTVP
jgi:hypothetical protein